MDERDWLAERFEESRPQLRAVAYRMLGSASEADDAVQETWLRLSRSGAGGVENLGGWLTTIVARVSLNMLRSRALRREEPMDSPVTGQPVTGEPVTGRANGADPEHEALRPALIDGAPGLMWTHRGETRVVFAFTITNDTITAIEQIADPERIARLEVVPLRAGARRGSAGSGEA